jgi:hypothetical protein
MRSLQRQPRLPHAAGAGEREQARRPLKQSAANGVQLGPTADRAVRRRRQSGAPTRGRCGGRQAGVVGEDRLVQLPQLVCGFDPELLDEPLASVLVGLECVGLTA